jgi:hypothetical protein
MVLLPHFVFDKQAGVFLLKLVTNITNPLTRGYA